MNVWQKRTCHNRKTFALPRCRKKQLPKSPESRASSRPWRAERAHDDRARRLGFRHACKMGLEGIVSKRIGSRDRSGSSPDWIKSKNPATPAVRWEAEED
jgi:ATP-dependent DNA ligase